MKNMHVFIRYTYAPLGLNIISLVSPETKSLHNDAMVNISRVIK
jgi:hypothetical protein